MKQNGKSMLFGAIFALFALSLLFSVEGFAYAQRLPAPPPLPSSFVMHPVNTQFLKEIKGIRVEQIEQISFYERELTPELDSPHYILRHRKAISDILKQFQSVTEWGNLNDPFANKQSSGNSLSIEFRKEKGKTRPPYRVTLNLPPFGTTNEAPIINTKWILKQVRMDEWIQFLRTEQENIVGMTLERQRTKFSLTDPITVVTQLQKINPNFFFNHDDPGLPCCVRFLLKNHLEKSFVLWLKFTNPTDEETEAQMKRGWVKPFEIDPTIPDALRKAFEQQSFVSNAIH